MLRPEVLVALEGCSLVLHAGDVGHPEVLEGLRALAPVVAVRGNVDLWARGGGLPPTQVVEAGGIRLYLIHDLREMDLVPEAAGFRCVVYGHTHRPEVRWEGVVLYLNPGSAGPRRGNDPVTVARVSVDEAGGLLSEIVPLGRRPVLGGLQGRVGDGPGGFALPPTPPGTWPR